MKSVLIWINSAPSSSNLTGAFQLAQCMRAQGRMVSILLAQDAVLAGVKTEYAPHALAAQALRADIATYALGEDLALRGFTPDALWDGMRVADYAQIVELFAQHAQVIGAL